jgi:6-phospho-beta-glucosidase
MRVTVIGGGGFRTPIVWDSLSRVAQDCSVEAVILHDVDETRLARVATVIEARRRELGSGPPVITTIDLDAATDGVDVVFCAIRVGGLSGRVVDETIPLREGVLGQETVGPGGISFALRTVPVIVSIAEKVAKRAPGAWFLNFTNPAGLVTEALRPALGDRVVGICDAPATLHAGVARALSRKMSELSFDYAGLNHLGWLLAVRDGSKDLLPELLTDTDRLSLVPEAALLGTQWVCRLRMIPNEYLVYYERPGEIIDALRRAGKTRAEILFEQERCFYSHPSNDPQRVLAAWRAAKDARFGTYMSEARPSSVRSPQVVDLPPDEGPGETGYAAIAESFLRGIAGASDATLTLNVPNRGAITAVPSDAVVEIPCRVATDGLHPEPVSALPSAQADLVARVKEVERLTLASLDKSSRAYALEAIATHPLVPDRGVAERILDAYIAAFPGLADRLR